MITVPVDRSRKQMIELSMAQVNPSASFEERVAQFDHMEAVAKKRKRKKKKDENARAIPVIFPCGFISSSGQ
jgi:hypothetical protein